MDLYFDPMFHPDQGVLCNEESHHAIRVKRHQKGDKIGVNSGKGTIYTGVISNPDPIALELSEITSIKTPPPSPQISLAVSLLKNHDRIEWMLEKCTELGFCEYIPIISRYSERKKINQSRLLKKAVSAIKQSNNPYLPKIQEPVKLKELITDKHFSNHMKFIAHPTKNTLESAALTKKILILIGPEGGFSEEEVTEAKKQGFVYLSLGQNILRTETAAVAALSKFVLG